MTLSARSGLALIILWAAWKPRSVRGGGRGVEEGEGSRREKGRGGRGVRREKGRGGRGVEEGEWLRREKG